MPKIASFILCDSIENINNSENEVMTKLVSPQIVLRPQYIPSNFSFGMALGISEITLKNQNSMKFTIKSPKGKVIQDSGVNPLPIINVEDTLEEKFQGFVINIDIRNLEISEAGIYKLEIFINDQTIGEENIPIFKGIKHA